MWLKNGLGTSVLYLSLRSVQKVRKVFCVLECMNINIMYEYKYIDVCFY